MKRIIELSENDYKALKEDGVQNHIALADTIIAHSVPYEEKPQTMSCFNCKYDYKSAVDEPCRYCEKHSEWQAKGGAE